MAPVPIEDDIKSELSEVVSQAMLVSIISIHLRHIFMLYLIIIT